MGCQNRSENAAEKLKKQNEEIQREAEKQINEAKKTLEEAMAILTSGGQPAEVYLSRVLTTNKSTSDINPIDGIKIQWLGGLGKDGKRAPVNIKKALQLDSSKAPENANPIPEKTYINIGCNNLPESDIQNYKPIKGTTASSDKTASRDSFVAIAARIFLCGKISTKQSLTQVTASEVILQDANIELNDSMLSFAIRANIIVMQGKNKISFKGKNSDMPSQQATGSISVLAESKLEGEGSLEIISEGSSYVATDKPANKPTESGPVNEKKVK